MNKLCQALIAAILLLSVNHQALAGPNSKPHINWDKPAPPEKLIRVAERLAFKDFPKAIDILAIARIESGFNEKAKNGISIGIMQVNHGPWDMVLNVTAGVKLLREYYGQLGSVKAAVMAYNIGIGNYRKGKRMEPYWNKYLGAKHAIEIRQAVEDNNRDTDSRGLGSGSGLPIGDLPERLPEHPGSSLLNDNGGPVGDSLPEWKSTASNFGERTTGEVPDYLGQIKESKWEPFLQSYYSPLSCSWQ